jgi:hypothetical protein
MIYRLLTDLTILLHFAFLIFVVAGGLLARRHRWLAVPHILAAAWGIYVEAMPGLRCPLTALENALALRAGSAGYEGGFIEHYLIPVIYPEGIGPEGQLMIAASVVLINVAIYVWPRRTPTGSSSAAKRSAQAE